MKIKDAIDGFNDLPPDYEFVLSKFVTIKENSEDYNIVEDIPIRGLAISDETKEVRLILQESDLSAINDISSKVYLFEKEASKIEKLILED